MPTSNHPSDLPRVNLIYARSTNHVIGAGNKLPWHLPEDLGHFKRSTQGHPVVMGRKTWDSLPEKFRPLPGRTNIVVTRQLDWEQPGAVVANSLEEALRQAGGAQEVWVIGGSEIYAQALSLADRVVVTVVDLEVQGDAYAPSMGPAWVGVAGAKQLSTTGLSYQFIEYTRASAHTI